MAGSSPSSRENDRGGDLVYQDKLDRTIHLENADLLPHLPPVWEKEEQARRRDPDPKQRPVYWQGRDWRKYLRRRGGGGCNRGLRRTLEVGDQGNTNSCSGFAVAHALRANVAIHRGVDIGLVNPHVITALARRSDRDLRYQRAGFLHEACMVVQSYAVATAPEIEDPKQLDPLTAHQIVENYTLDWKADELPDPHIAERPELMAFGRGGRVPGRVNGSARKIQGIVDLSRYVGDQAAWLTAFGPLVAHMIVDRNKWNEIKKVRAPLDEDRRDERYTAAKPPMIRYEANQIGEDADTQLYGGHDVVVVGYVPLQQGVDDPRADSFIIMNSYGPDWGQNGFAYISVEEAREAFRAVYGFLLREHLGYRWRGLETAPQSTSYLGRRTRDIW